MAAANQTSPSYDASSTDPFDLDGFTKELNRLSEVNHALLSGVTHEAPADPVESDELTALRHENVELRGQLREYEDLLSRGGPSEDNWSERQREYEALLEEKSEVIRALHMRLQDMQEAGSRVAPGAQSSGDDLARQRAEIEEERRRLVEDEEAMSTQMRAMEMALSRDRAELARQRQEVQRLQADLNREVEMAGRDSGLHDRLKSMRRLPEAAKTPPAATPAVAEEVRPQKSSGIFRRMFG